MALETTTLDLSVFTLITGFWLLMSLTLQHVAKLNSTIKNSIIELTFYTIVCAYAFVIIALEFKHIGSISSHTPTRFLLIFFISFFIYEAVVKRNIRFTVVHHLSLALILIFLIKFGYYVGIVPMLFLYELPGIPDIINRHFISKKSRYRKQMYQVAVATRILTTAIIGLTVLTLMALNINPQNQIADYLNIFLAIISATLNFYYSVKSIKMQTKKLRVMA